MTTLVSHNVLVTLGPEDARRAMVRVLEPRPQVVCLQEWQGKARRAVLARSGLVVRWPKLRRTLRLRYPTSAMVWGLPWGGSLPVGVDASWGELWSVRKLVLAPREGTTRPTYATEALVRERATGELHVVLNTHLMAHHDVAANERAWRTAVEALEVWAESWHGFSRFVLMDANADATKLVVDKLVPCWQGQERHPTHGKRTIDGVWHNGPATKATTLRTASDHRAVLATY